LVYKKKVDAIVGIFTVGNVISFFEKSSLKKYFSIKTAVCRNGKFDAESGKKLEKEFLTRYIISRI
jgi:hypothetical protein